MPGRFLTGSSPVRTSIEAASYWFFKSGIPEYKAVAQRQSLVIHGHRPDIIRIFFQVLYYERVTLYSQCKYAEFPEPGAGKIY
jgi:hypothetical protein